MAQIINYNPGSVPNLGVGTPGLNMAPGETFRALSKDIGNTRKAFAAAKMASTQAILEPIAQQMPYLGMSIGRSFSQIQEQKAQQRVKQFTMLANNQVAKKLFEFQSAADDLRNTSRGAFADHPEYAPDFYSSSAQSHADVAQQQLEDQFPNNPEYGQKFREQADQYIRSQKEGVTNWSYSQGTENAKAGAATIQATSVASVENADGSPVDKQVALGNALEHVKQYATANAPILGQAQMTKYVQDTSFKLGAAYFGNMLNNLPQVPEGASPNDKASVLEGRIDYLRGVERDIKYSQNLGIPLDNEAKHALLGQVRTQSGQISTDLEEFLKVKSNSDTNTISNWRADVAQNTENKVVLHSAISYASDQIKQLNSQVNQKIADKQLPDKVKEAYVNNHNVQINKLTTLINDATGHIEAIRSRAQAAALHAQAEANANAREQRREIHEQKHEQSLQAQTAVNLKAEEIRSLTLEDPVKNGPRIRQLTGELRDYASGLEKDEKLTPGQASKQRMFALTAKHTVDAAEFKKQQHDDQLVVDRLSASLSKLQEGDALKNMPAIKNQGQLLFDHVEKMEDRGTITPAQGKALRESTQHITRLASDIIRDVPVKFGIPIPIPDITLPGGFQVYHAKQKKGSYDRTVQQRDQNLKELTGVITSVLDMSSQRQINEANNFTDAEQNRFYTGAAVLQQKAVEQKWTAANVTSKYNDLRNAIVLERAKQKVSQPAWTGTTFSWPTSKVATSNGYADAAHIPGVVVKPTLDMTKRTLVEFPHGMDASNSTEAARATVPHANFPADSHGTDYSMTVDDGKYAVVIPSIFDGKLHSVAEAFEHYKRTGEHMGKFDLAAERANGYKNSEKYTTLIHKRKLSVNGVPIE